MHPTRSHDTGSSPVATPLCDEQAELGRLLAHVAHGDTAAFADLFEVLAPTVYGLCLRILRDSDHAEDATQDTFVELWRTAPRYDPARGTPVAWTLTIARRRAVDRVRTVQAATDRDRPLAARISPDPCYDTAAEDALARLGDPRLNAELSAALATLSPLQRQAIEIVYYRGCTCSEAARMINVPLGTLKTRVRDAMKCLRATLARPDEVTLPAPEMTRPRR